MRLVLLGRRSISHVSWFCQIHKGEGIFFPFSVCFYTFYRISIVSIRSFVWVFYFVPNTCIVTFYCMRDLWLYAILCKQWQSRKTHLQTVQYMQCSFMLRTQYGGLLFTIWLYQDIRSLWNRRFLRNTSHCGRLLVHIWLCTCQKSSIKNIPSPDGPL